MTGEKIEGFAGRAGGRMSDNAALGHPTIAATIGEKKQSGNVGQFSINEVPFTAEGD